MPPKKDAAASDGKILAGFEDKETKLIAAAFVSSTGPDKYDYDLMATLTNNTAGSLKKMWPPVKKKVIDAYPSFATFLGSTGANITAKDSGAKPAAAAPKPAGGRKRKATTEVEDEADADANVDTEETKAKPATKGKGGRKPKAATVSPTEAADKPKAVRSSSRQASAEPKSAAVETKKKAPAKARPAKKSKKEAFKSEDDSADGGDGLGQYTRKAKVEKWLDDTDDGLETIGEVEDEV